jgi:hypothetical protein
VIGVTAEQSASGQADARQSRSTGIVSRGNPAMNAAAASKPEAMNKLEGFALTAILMGFPNFAPVALMLKLVGDHQIAGSPTAVALFVTLTTLVYAMIGPPLGRRYPKIVRYGFEPLFFDPTLSFGEKIAKWRTQPKASLQLLTTVFLQSALALVVASAA